LRVTILFGEYYEQIDERSKNQAGESVRAEPPRPCLGDDQDEKKREFASAPPQLAPQLSEGVIAWSMY
jgi:hypothetical protein